MDSLSQIVLGAAVGEAVLGRRIGNRAMVWGAVAGTLPDMDVLGKYFLSELDNLAFHRGISHSLLFCVLGALVLGWMTHRLYQSPHHAKVAVGTKVLAAVVIGFVVNFLTQIFAPGTWWPVAVYVPLVGVWGWRRAQKRYFEGRWEAPNADLKGWVLLFFGGFLTHTLLDCFTTYGTQLFAPFSDQRVAWGTVAVADPLYTLPFLLCLLVAARCSREGPRRRAWNAVGLGWSCLYLTLTVVNHQRVQRTFSEALEAQGRAHVDFMITPTIFNNLLWNAVVDTGDGFLLAQHSILDEVPISFHPVAQGHELLHNLDTDETLQVLRWFSAGYFNAVRRDDGSLQLNDLRFGTFSGRGENADDYIFRFKLTDRGPDQPYGFERAQGGPPDDKAEDMMMDLFERACGLSSNDDHEAAK
ncbi:MAG: metal-dependent hydrolase [Flavobacteriales bacterium]|nr:metal-dependent hydrolase [Flavobacteriales bacterium]